MSFAIKLRGAQEAGRAFGKLASQISTNKAPMYKRIGVKLMNEISKTFQAETWEGQAWKPLADSTISSRRKGKGTISPKILQDTGTLRRSFVMEANNSSVRVGSPIQYSDHHEFGTDRIPQRPMLPSKGRGIEIGVEVADAYIIEKVKEAGFSIVKGIL